MKFYDIAEVKLQSWKWWDWCSAARKEKYVSHWWPAWWDWWKWWDVIIKASKDINTLLYYKYKRLFKAESWENWKTSDKYWANWNDLVLEVPIWTVIKDKEKWSVMYQFLEDNETFQVLKWWKWGLWNIHFKTSTRQFPNFALMWEPWDSLDVVLELQILWDVALVWIPSVWKSTLINCLTNVKAKVAEYHFTTIIPNLWIVKDNDFSFSVVDVPWLVEWSYMWKWLWTDFLRHILKAKIFLFVMDISRDVWWLDDFLKLLNEINEYIKLRYQWTYEFWYYIENIIITYSLEDWFLYVNYSANDTDNIILKKVIRVLFNKFDYINQDSELFSELLSIFNLKLEKIFTKPQQLNLIDNIICTSWVSYYWIDNLTKNLWESLRSISSIDFIKYDIVDYEKWSENYINNITDIESSFLLEMWYVQSDDDIFEVWEILNSDISYYVFTLPWWNAEAENRFWSTLTKKWLISFLESHWIMRWDILKIKSLYRWVDDKYIRYMY